MVKADGKEWPKLQRSHRRRHFRSIRWVVAPSTGPVWAARLAAFARYAALPPMERPSTSTYRFAAIRAIAGFAAAYTCETRAFRGHGQIGVVFAHINIKNRLHIYQTHCSNCRELGWTPLVHWSDPQTLINFNPPRGSPQPPSSLLIEYCFAIAVIIYWTSGPTRKRWRLFEIKNVKFCGRAALHNPTVGSRRVPSRHNIPTFLDLTAYSARPPELFLNINLFEHWPDAMYRRGLRSVRHGVPNLISSILIKHSIVDMQAKATYLIKSNQVTSISDHWVHRK